MSTQVLYILGGYFVGSILGGYLLVKLFHKEEFTKQDLPGASGTSRQLGMKAGISVGAFDILKGVLVASVGIWLNFDLIIVVSACLAAVIGHNWPIFFRFKGGGGLATSVGILVVLLPKELAVSLGFGIPVVILYKKLSSKEKITPAPLGAIVGFPILLVSVWYFNEPFEFLILCLGFISLSLLKLIQWRIL